MRPKASRDQGTWGESAGDAPCQKHHCDPQLHEKTSVGPESNNPALAVKMEQVQGKCSKLRRELGTMTLVREARDAHK